jgi:hypothetical protein
MFEMTVMKKLAATLAFSMLPVAALAATIGGTEYAPQYDYREFFTAATASPSAWCCSAIPSPGMAVEQVAGTALAQMQGQQAAASPDLHYDQPAEQPRPDYRLVLMFDPGQRHGRVFRVRRRQAALQAGTPGRVYMQAVYCRNDLALSQTTAWTDAAWPRRSRMGELFRELFPVVFSDAMGLRPQSGGSMR